MSWAELIGGILVCHIVDRIPEVIGEKEVVNMCSQVHFPAAKTGPALQN